LEIGSSVKLCISLVFSLSASRHRAHTSLGGRSSVRYQFFFLITLKTSEETEGGYYKSSRTTQPRY
jgi:hypothetical protein